MIYAREILTSTREKKSFCARENVRVPDKICAKVGEKNKFPPKKNPQKIAKKCLLGHFSFSREKKTVGNYLKKVVYKALHKIDDKLTEGTILYEPAEDDVRSA